MRKNLSLTAFLMMICVIGLVSTCNGQNNMITFKIHEYESYPTKSKYNVGFQYYSTDGAKMTLLEWAKEVSKDDYPKEWPEQMRHDQYRWRVKIERCGVSAIGWTSDLVIDVALGKLIVWNGQAYEPVTK